VKFEGIVFRLKTADSFVEVVATIWEDEEDEIHVYELSDEFDGVVVMVFVDVKVVVTESIWCGTAARPRSPAMTIAATRIMAPVVWELCGSISYTTSRSKLIGHVI
jgi:hypothetical protein